MAHHILSLEIPDVLNKCVIRLEDTGLYASWLPINCFTLEITAPGFTDPSVITTLTPNYTANLSACDLGLQTTNCDNYNNNLQDGVYIIRQSLSPNDIVYVEYNHLRITLALNKYQALLCCIQKSFNCDPAPEVKKKLMEAQFIRTLLDAAKAEVEYCHSPKNGVTTYLYAVSRLDKLLCACSCPEC